MTTLLPRIAYSSDHGYRSENRWFVSSSNFSDGGLLNSVVELRSSGRCVVRPIPGPNTGLYCLESWFCFVSMLSESRMVGSVLQLRETVRNFCDKELAPYADEIDRNNEFKDLRVSRCVK